MQEQIRTSITSTEPQEYRKIKFLEHPVFQHKSSLPALEYKKPASILKRKGNSLFQEFHSGLLEDNQKSQFVMPFIQKKPSFKQNSFRIEEAPHLPEQIIAKQKQFMMKQSIASIENKRQRSLSNSRVEIGESREIKIPMWGYILFGFCVLVIGGWIISTAFLSKINQSKQIRNQIRKQSLTVKKLITQTHHLDYLTKMRLRKNLWDSPSN